MATLVGVRPNIIISSFREKALGSHFLMFDCAPVGGIVALAELTVSLYSDLVEILLRDLNGAASECDFQILGSVRKGKGFMVLRKKPLFWNKTRLCFRRYQMPWTNFAYN